MHLKTPAALLLVACRAAGRGLNLQAKLVALLLVVVLIPAAASAYLVTRMSRVAANFAAVEAEARNRNLERALRT